MQENSFSTQKVKDQAARLAQYLNTQGVALSRQQSLEGVCRAVHGRPWNVVKTLATPSKGRATSEASLPELKAVYFTYLKTSDATNRCGLAVLAQRWHEASNMSETVNINVQLHQMTDAEVLCLFQTQGTTAWLKLPGRREAHPREAEGELMHTSCEAVDSFAQWLAAFRPHLLLDYLAYRFFAGPKALLEGLNGLLVEEQDGAWFVRIPEDTHSRTGMDLALLRGQPFDTQVQAEQALSRAILGGLASSHPARQIREDLQTLAIEFGSGVADEHFAQPVVAGRKDVVTGAPLVLKNGDPALTRQQLKSITEGGKYYVDVVMLMSISKLMEGIETCDDYVAERITGSVAELPDILFEAAPLELNLPAPQSDNIWMRVVADWDSAAAGEDDDPA